MHSLFSRTGTKESISFHCPSLKTCQCALGSCVVPVPLVFTGAAFPFFCFTDAIGVTPSKKRQEPKPKKKERARTCRWCAFHIFHVSHGRSPAVAGHKMQLVPARLNLFAEQCFLVLKCSVYSRQAIIPFPCRYTSFPYTRLSCFRLSRYRLKF